MTNRDYANRENLSKGVKKMIFIDENINKDKIGIYQIINLKNNKIYIGQTKDRFIERFWNHQWKLNNNIHDNDYLQKSWNKYGKDSFEFSVLYVLKKDEDIDELEKYYISEYKKKYTLYNIQIGGQCSTMKNVPMSEETKRKIGEKNKINSYGKKASKETKQKMSKTKLNKTNWGACKLTKKQAKLIKTKLMLGVRPIDLSKELDIDYKIINNIFSNNTYKSVIVDGWEKFYENRPHYTNAGNRKISKDKIKEIIEVYNITKKYTETAKICGVSRDTATKTIKNI